MEFFNKLGNMASETYKYTADKTNKLAKETKTKIKMNEYKSEIEGIYEEIGKIVYQKHVREEDINIKEDLQEYCDKIDILSQKVEECRMKILNLKDKKQCPSCFTEIEKEDNFCPKCGAIQPEEVVEVKETEIIKEEVVKESEEQEERNEEEKEEE